MCSPMSFHPSSRFSLGPANLKSSTYTARSSLNRSCQNMDGQHSGWSALNPTLIRHDSQCSLPKAPRIRVSVQCQDEPDNGVFVFTNPLLRPTVSRNANPCLWAFQCGLGVRLLAITLANPVPRRQIHSNPTLWLLPYSQAMNQVLQTMPSQKTHP